MIKKHAHEELLNKTFIVTEQKRRPFYTNITTKNTPDYHINDLDPYAIDFDLEPLL